jgi:hypothetical protein
VHVHLIRRMDPRRGRYLRRVERAPDRDRDAPPERLAVERLVVDRLPVDRLLVDLRVPVERPVVFRAELLFRVEALLRAELVFRAGVPLVAAFCTFSRSRVTVRLRLVRFLRESFSVRSKFFTAVLLPRPSSLRRSFNAISAASSDFSKRPIAFGPTTLRPRVFAAAVTRLLVDLFFGCGMSLLLSSQSACARIIAIRGAPCSSGVRAPTDPTPARLAEAVLLGVLDHHDAADCLTRGCRGQRVRALARSSLDTSPDR